MIKTEHITTDKCLRFTPNQVFNVRNNERPVNVYDDYIEVDYRGTEVRRFLLDA